MIRRIAIVATIVATATLTSTYTAAGQATPARAWRASGYVGSIPYPLGPRDGCGDAFGALAGAIGFSQRLLPRLRAAANLTMLADAPIARCVTDAIFPLPPGTYYRRRYPTDLEANPIIAPDVRARVTGRDGRVWELEGGGGLTLSPGSVPFAVFGGGFVFGHRTHVIVGVEYRRYWIPYDSVRSEVTETDRTDTKLRSGREGMPSWLFRIALEH